MGVTTLISIRSQALTQNKLGQRFLIPRRHIVDGRQNPSQSRGLANLQPTRESEDLSDWGLVWLFLRRIAIAAGISHVMTEYVVDITVCEGPSMLPTIHYCGDALLVEKMSTSYFGIHDGESAIGRTQAARLRQDKFPVKDVWHQIISTEKPPPHFSWKRALREQLLSPISIGDVVVASHPLRTGTICKRVAGLPGDQVIERRTGKIQRIPDGHVWLEGDNAGQSNDSRFYGAIPAAHLKGRVVARIWPLGGSGWIRRMHPQSTVLPAGYEGEYIARSEFELESLSDL